MTEPNNFYPSNIVLCVVKVLLCLSAIMLNSISIHAIRKTSSLQKTLKIMLLSLAVSDLGVGLLVYPLAIVISTLEMTSNAQNNPAYMVILIRVFQVPLNLFYYATFFGVTALSVERFLAIFFHLRYQELVTYKRVVAAVISIWISCAFLSCIQFWTTPLIRNVVYVTMELACLLTTALLYYKIYQAVRRHTREIESLQVETLGGDITRTTRRFKSAIGTFYIYLAFLACYLPHNCTYLARLILGSSYNLGLVGHLMQYTLTLTWLNSSLNPLIYTWKMKPVRLAIRNTLQNILINRFSRG